MVIAIPEVRRLLFQHCDNQSLARLIRCKKELVYEASRLLYATMDWKFVRDTLCRKKVSIPSILQLIYDDVWHRTSTHPYVASRRPLVPRNGVS